MTRKSARADGERLGGNVFRAGRRKKEIVGNIILARI